MIGGNVNIYSPKPLQSYTVTVGSHVYRVAKTIPEWNLIWLSLPKVDELLDPGLVITEWAKGFDWTGSGHLAALASFHVEGCSVADLMGPSPIQFVQDLQDLRDLPASKQMWTHLGGQAWIDMMVARAYQSAGMSEVLAAAKKSSNVILADFRAKRRG